MRWVVVCMFWLALSCVTSARAQALELQRGAWSAELLSAGGAAAFSATATYFALQMPRWQCHESGGDVPTIDPCVFRQATPALAAIVLIEGVAPLLTASAVTFAGNMSGGEGRFGRTLLATYAVGAVATVVGLLATQNRDLPPGQQTNNFYALDSRVVVPLTAAGMAAGAVVGYRWSARTPRRFEWAPTFGRNALGLTVHAVL